MGIRAVAEELLSPLLICRRYCFAGFLSRRAKEEESAGCRYLVSHNGHRPGSAVSGISGADQSKSKAIAAHPFHTRSSAHTSLRDAVFLPKPRSLNTRTLGGIAARRPLMGLSKDRAGQKRYEDEDHFPALVFDQQTGPFKPPTEPHDRLADRDKLRSLQAPATVALCETGVMRASVASTRDPPQAPPSKIHAKLARPSHGRQEGCVGRQMDTRAPQV